MENKTENHEQEEMIPKSADVSMEDDTKSDVAAEDMDTNAKEGTSPNVSGSSDLVSGTPQKPCSSRRQSFITLEKYAERKPASPKTASTFTGPLIKTSNSQEHSDGTDTSSPQATGPNSQDCHSSQTGQMNSQCPVNNIQESPRRPKVDSGKKSEPVRLTERLPSHATEDEDVIPDTQAEAEVKENTEKASTLEEIKPSSQEGESQQSLILSSDSQSSETLTSPGEPRRSGRYRVRPVLPGEDPEDSEKKYMLVKRRRSGEENKGVSPGSRTLQDRPNTRSKQAAEEDSGRLRTRAQRDMSESSQTNSQDRSHRKSKLYSNSEQFLAKPEHKRRSTRDQESSQTDLQSDTQSDYESQSQGRNSRLRKSSLEKNVLPEKESSPTATPELELVEQVKKDVESNKVSQMVTSSPQTDGRSQEYKLAEQAKNEKVESPIIASSPNNGESQVRTSTTSQLENESQEVVKDQHKTIEDTDDNLSQEDSQVITPSSSDSQSRRRSRRSKASAEAAESEDKRNSSRRQSRSNSQTTVSAVSQAEARIGGRTRRSKVQEEQSMSSPSSTPGSSQSLDIAGSSESSQGRGRYSRRRSSQVLSANTESSESESLEAGENSPVPKKRGRKPRAQSLASPLTVEPKDRIDGDIAKSDICQKAAPQSIETTNITDLEDSQKSQDLQGSESLRVTGNVEEQSNEGGQMEVEVAAAVDSEPVLQKTETGDSEKSSVSPCKKDETNADDTTSQEGDMGDSHSAGMLESVGISTDQIQEDLSCGPSDLPAVDTPGPPEMTEELQVSESSQEKEAEVAEPGDVVTENEKDSDPDHQELPVVPVEDTRSTSSGQNQEEGSNVIDKRSKEEEQSAPIEEDKSTNQLTEASAGEDVTPLQDNNNDSKTQIIECQDEEKIQTTDTENDAAANLESALSDVGDASVTSESTAKDVFQESPVKQKDLEAVMGPDAGQSPISGRTRGTWSPSASPSTSILKKGQKRPLEEDTPSPLIKVSVKCSLSKCFSNTRVSLYKPELVTLFSFLQSRRVSFANPIQQQETADDIDRRSPAVRTSSPKRSKISSIPQPKV